MKKEFCWQLGFCENLHEIPGEMFPAAVPGAVQLDWARCKDLPPYWKGVNFRDYKWMEDKFWLYRTELSFDIRPQQRAWLCFEAIDYQYRICIDGEILLDGEGMFTPIRLDVSRFSGGQHELCVWIYPAPKADDSDTRDQARESCKAAACYGWDWHPRLVSLGIWGEAWLEIDSMSAITALEARYRLSDDLRTCTIDVELESAHTGPFRVLLLDGTDIAVRVETQEKTLCIELENPKLWYPRGYGAQPIYTIRALALGPDGAVLAQRQRKIGLRRSRLVMNEGAWREPSGMPKSRSDAPATLEINGRRIFAKGSNWVNAQIFPGQMTREHYDTLLTLAADAHMNILRIWGGGFINKESFFELCDEKGIMLWQEFPLACNEYPDKDEYLAVLAHEAPLIVRRLRTHPSLVLWCGGNELFNSWSGMTEQHHALRLLDSICYQEDRFTPFIMTSPLNGMAHGHYINYDEDTGLETIELFNHAHNTAYTEFGCPGMSQVEYLRTFMEEEDIRDFRPENEVWREHHAFEAWREKSWAREEEAEYFFGGYEDIDDLCRKTSFIQAMCYKSNFEAMRRQWPHAAMALNWCFNEPWPTAANNSLVSWPDSPKAAYYAVAQALRPQLASLRIPHHLWHSGETFSAEIWMLNDSPEVLEGGRVELYYCCDGEEEIYWGGIDFDDIPPQSNLACGAAMFKIPENFEGLISVRLEVLGRAKLESWYNYPCRSAKSAPKRRMLNA